MTNKEDASTTDRESAIMFGLPSKLIEGGLVGRKFEYDSEVLTKIKKNYQIVIFVMLMGK